MLQARWARYAAIGAAVRGGVRLGGKVARRVSAVIADETDLVQVERRSAAGSACMRARPQPGARLQDLRLAAGVAAVSILLLHGGAFPGSLTATPTVVASRAELPAAAAIDTPASYVVPRDHRVTHDRAGDRACELRRRA